jgi:hypothetical protein
MLAPQPIPRLGIRHWVLTRLEQIGDGSYEPGTAAPRASARFIDGLDALDPDFEDSYDAALATADAAACEAREDAAALQ